MKEMTDGEKMVWAAAFVAELNNELPARFGIAADRWRENKAEREHAVTIAAERATLTVEALRSIQTESVGHLCDDGAMLSAILECDA